MSPSSSALFRAADIVEEIELLQKQVSDLLENQELATEPLTDSNPIEKTANPSSNGRGTLDPAVLKVLKESKEPLKSAAIYERLVASGYQFSFKDPTKVLQIRLYKMPGIKKAGKGLFKAK